MAVARRTVIPVIIPQKLFDRVAARMAKNKRAPATP